MAGCVLSCDVTGLASAPTGAAATAGAATGAGGAAAAATGASAETVGAAATSASARLAPGLIKATTDCSSTGASRSDLLPSCDASEADEDGPATMQAVDACDSPR